MAVYHVKFDSHEFETTVVPTPAIETLPTGMSVTITRLPDKHYVPVKLITRGGFLSVKTYTYTHTALLGAGTLVQVPSQRWQRGESAFGVVQAAEVDPASAAESIVRVVS